MMLSVLSKMALKAFYSSPVWRAHQDAATVASSTASIQTWET